MRLPLMNEDVHTDELLDHYNYALVELYKHVPLLNLPDPSRIAHRFGARCGENLTDEERAERKVCSPSADMKEAWRAYHADEELTPEQCRLVRHAAAVIEAIRARKAGDALSTEQQELVKDHHAWLTFEAWNDYHASGGDMSQLSTDQQELLKDSYFWKVHVAWKEYHASGGDITKLSDEKQELLESSPSWKLQEAWKEYHANGGDITKLSKEKRELLMNNPSWKRHNEAFVKHVKTIEQMKKDNSNYVQVGDEEVFYVPLDNSSALYAFILSLRRLDEGNWKRQKFEQAAGISLSKLVIRLSKNKPGASKASPKGRPTDDVTYQAAIEFLTKKTRDMARPEIPGTDIGQGLIERSDADLLTDYFYHMMQQLVVCHFSEKDRKSRGGKRENVNIGYGGLQCIHCIEAPQARKFFWSTVDRLANSFAEIPTHVLKCKHCPDNMKDALLALKGRHSDQMQMLPRGSQKVVFRRMWRRLHDGDTELTPVKDQVSRGREPPLPTTDARASESLVHRQMEQQYQQELFIQQQQQLIVQQQLNQLQQEQQRLLLPFPIQQQQDLDPLLIQQALADFKRMTGREYGGGQV